MRQSNNHLEAESTTRRAAPLSPHDYYATLKIQQGRLKAAMRRMGIRTASELARLAGTTATEVGKYLNFKRSPMCKSTPNGSEMRWRRPVVNICKVLGESPESLFPQHLQHEVSTNSISSYIHHAQLEGRTEGPLLPSDTTARSEATQILNDVLDTLTEREQSIIRRRWLDGMTLAAAGKEIGVSRERARQIEAKAFRKLHHPSRMDKLAEAWR